MNTLRKAWFRSLHSSGGRATSTSALRRAPRRGLGSLHSIPIAMVAAAGVVACTAVDDSAPRRVQPPPAETAGLGDQPVNPSLPGTYCGCTSVLYQGEFELEVGPLYLPQ